MARSLAFRTRTSGCRGGGRAYRRWRTTPARLPCVGSHCCIKAECCCQPNGRSGSDFEQVIVDYGNVRDSMGFVLGDLASLEVGELLETSPDSSFGTLEDGPH